MEDLFITAKEVMELGYSRDTAYELIAVCRNELEDKGFYLPKGSKAPRNYVIRKMGVME